MKGKGGEREALRRYSVMESRDIVSLLALHGWAFFVFSVIGDCQNSVMNHSKTTLAKFRALNEESQVWKSRSNCATVKQMSPSEDCEATWNSRRYKSFSFRLRESSIGCLGAIFPCTSTLIMSDDVFTVRKIILGSRKEWSDGDTGS